MLLLFRPSSAGGGGADPPVIHDVPIAAHVVTST